jgi:hypothetical protein
MIARAQKEAAGAAQRGDIAGSREWLVNARGCAQAMPTSPDIQAELVALDDLEAALNAGHNQAYVKGAKYRAYGRKQSRSPIPPKPPGSQPPAGS